MTAITLTFKISPTELQNLAVWAEEHPAELVILDFSRSVSMTAVRRQQGQRYRSMLASRQKELSTIFLSILGDVLLNAAQFHATDPTVDELLRTGRNVLLSVRSEYFRRQSDLFWPSIIHHDYEPAENPEDLFNITSHFLSQYKQHGYDDDDKLTSCLSLVVTPGAKMLAGAVSRLINRDPDDRYDWRSIQAMLTDSVDPQLAWLFKLVDGFKLQVNV